MTWQARGLCTEHPNPEWWMPLEGREGDPRAIPICGECPVREACAAEGERLSHGAGLKFDRDAVLGVWGGFDWGHYGMEMDRRKKRRDPTCYCERPQCRELRKEAA